MNAIDSTWGLRDSTAHECIELIRRCAPSMMIRGAGPLKREMLHLGKRLRPQQHQRIVRLMQRGDLSQAEVARQVGCTQPCVAKIMKKWRAGLVSLPEEKAA